MKTIYILLSFVCLMSCNGSEAPANKNEADFTISNYSNQLVDDKNKLEDQVDYKPPPPSSPVYDSAQKKIQEGEIVFKTQNIRKSSAWVKKQTEQLKGYISNENWQSQTEKIENELIIRIPAASLQILIDSITSEVGNLDSKQISIEDVTAEYMDMEVRINNKKALENRYKQLLDKASKVADMLEIENQMGDLREEIEATEGRLRLMKNQVSMSSLRIRMYEEHISSSPFTNQLKEAFIQGWRGFIQVCMLVLYSWVFLLIAAIGWIIYRKRILNRKK